MVLRFKCVISQDEAWHKVMVLRSLGGCHILFVCWLQMSVDSNVSKKTLRKAEAGLNILAKNYYLISRYIQVGLPEELS